MDYCRAPRQACAAELERGFPPTCLRPSWRSFTLPPPQRFWDVTQETSWDSFIADLSEINEANR